jgi:O-antigen/teichoic acid export membrane protein
MNLLKVGLLFAGSTLSKLFAGLLIVKIIAITVGAEGLGRLGQFMSLMSMVTILAGGGITSGIIKYVSEFKEDKENLPKYVRAASLVTISASIIVCISLFVLAEKISYWLFKTSEYFVVIRVLSFAQILIAISNFLFGLANGYKRVKAFAAINIVSVIFGAGAVGISCSLFGMKGAMYGLIWMSVCPIIFLLPWYKFGLKFKWSQIYPKWDKEKFNQFTHYSLMLFVSVLTMQMSQIIVRHIIEASNSWVQVGYWQAVSKISDAYLQFITVVLANYFLPRLAELKKRSEIKKEVRQAYKYAMPTLIAMGFMVFICRDWIILLIFSREFLPMKEFFTFQLLGDAFKIAAYIGGYVAVAKANTKIYIAAELVQSSMLIFFCYIFVGKFGAVGATYAYCLNYVIYFMIVSYVLRYYLNRQDDEFADVGKIKF